MFACFPCVSLGFEQAFTFPPTLQNFYSRVILRGHLKLSAGVKSCLWSSAGLPTCSECILPNAEIGSTSFTWWLDSLSVSFENQKLTLTQEYKLQFIGTKPSDFSNLLWLQTSNYFDPFLSVIFEEVKWHQAQAGTFRVWCCVQTGELNRVMINVEPHQNKVQKWPTCQSVCQHFGDAGKLPLQILFSFIPYTNRKAIFQPN